MNIFISIATYNEKENIAKLISNIFALGLDNLSVVVTDDNSPDRTAQVVSKLEQKFSNLYLNLRKNKKGYGSAHISGFKYAIEAGADIIISMDADFSHNPNDIFKLIKAIELGADVAVGSRKIKGGQIVGWNLWRHFASTGAMLVSRLVLGIKTRDLTSGFRAYKKQVLKAIDYQSIISNGYSFLEETIYLIEKKGFKIKEVPIVFKDRKYGRSKLSKKEIIKFFITIWRLRFSQK